MANVLHSLATGIHPGAYAQPTAPANPYTVAGVAYALPDRVLWVDTSVGPPYQLKCWNATTSTWDLIGSGSTLPVDCLTFPNGATICNDVVNEVHVNTPDAQLTMDTMGYTLPGGHRLEEFL